MNEGPDEASWPSVRLRPTHQYSIHCVTLIMLDQGESVSGSKNMLAPWYVLVEIGAISRVALPPCDDSRDHVGRVGLHRELIARDEHAGL